MKRHLVYKASVSFSDLTEAADLHNALVAHFSFLADNEGFHSVLSAIMEEALEITVSGNRLVVTFPGNRRLTCAPPADMKKYSGWPESFQDIVRHHEYISFPEEGWSLNLGNVGSFEPEYLEEVDSELLDVVDDPDEILCPITDYSDWWLYHPDETNAAGEPALCFFSHEGGDIDASIEYNAGSFILIRMAEIMDLETEVPAVQKLVPNAEELTSWYNGLSESWRKIIRDECDCESEPSPQELSEALKTISLTVNESDIDSLNPLRKFTKLKELTLDDTAVSSLEGIELCKSLAELDLSGAKVKDLSMLSHFPRLETLNLSETPIETLDAIPPLNKLEQLTLFGTRISSLEGVERFPEIENIEFGNTDVSSLEPLRDLKNLSRVDLCNTKVTDLSPIYGKKKIYILQTNGTKIPFAQILQFKTSITSKDDDDDDLLGCDIYCDELRNSRSLSAAIRNLETLTPEQSEVLAGWVNNTLISKLKNKKNDEARALLEAFLEMESLVLSDFIRNELSGNAVVLIHDLRDEALSKRVFEKLMPETVKDKRLAYNLACYYAGKKKKKEMMRYAAIALQMGYERSRFKDKDFDNFRDDPEFIQLYTKSGTPDPLKNPAAWWSTLEPETQDDVLWAAEADEGDFKKILSVTELTDIRDIKSLEPFRCFKKLKRLYVSYSSFTSVGPLAGLTALEELGLSGEHYISNKKISNIEALANCRKLKRLEITDHDVEDLTPLAGLIDLEMLSLTGNKITDITPLKNLKNLKQLRLRGNSIADLSVVAGFKELTHLDAVIKGISDFSFVSELTKLERLWTGDKVTTLSYFDDLKNLRYLCVFGKIDPQEEKAFQKRYPGCELSLDSYSIR